MIDVSIMKYMYRIHLEKSRFLFFFVEGAGDPRFFERETEEEVEEKRIKNFAGSILFFSGKQDDAEFIENPESLALLEQIRILGHQEAWKRVDSLSKEDNYDYADVREALKKENTEIPRLMQQERARELIAEIRNAVKKIMR